ncbi:MAG TPA: maleylacetoacetate isomerase [Alphaproteobacteria bacterium]|jgi:maleylacetoacetate isomerase
MKLHGFFRSSASYRLRIALALKGIEAEQVSVHISRPGGGDQFLPGFRALNPQLLVPVLEDDGKVLVQSLAILEYFEETHPAPAILPKTPAARARVRALAQVIACEMHPINNLRVLNYLTKDLGVSEDAKLAWYRHWVKLGFDALEPMLAGHPDTGTFCHGDTPTIADICLVPQVFNAKRFECPLDAYPTVMRIYEACEKLPAFAGAHPSKQPDAA